jgi:phosphoribosyl 1,2-cyclic phosphate phosphodiesterase
MERKALPYAKICFMNLFFLGTAAAEGYPGTFCNCANCNEARTLGGRSIRFRSTLLVNDDLLIDFGPDLSASAQRFHKNLSLVTTGLVTHAHGDHFYPFNFEMRHANFTGGQPIRTMHVFGPQEVADTLNQLAPDLSLLRLQVSAVHAFDEWQAGGYHITAYRAYHAVDILETLFYSVDDGRHAFLYASDTGLFPDDTWQALQGRTFDAIILEETMGYGSYSQHIGFDTFLEMAGKIRAAGMLRPNGRLIAHHMSHSGNPTHEKVEAILNPHGVEVAYDGLEVVLSA